MVKYIRLIQVESLFFLFIFVFLTYYFSDRINWWTYFALFWMIDFFGYWPGRVWSLYFKTEYPPAFFYWSYNLFHSLTFLTVFSFIWWYVLGPEYALLGLFTHLFIDRGVLYNFPKHRSDEFSFPTKRVLEAKYS